MASDLYKYFQEIRSPAEIRAINERIRDMMSFGKMKQDLITLKKQSDLLCAYLFSAEAEIRFGESLEEMRRAAMEENAKTSAHGNSEGTRRDWDVKFLPWGTSTYGPRYPPAAYIPEVKLEEG